MKTFFGEDFLLDSAEAKRIYDSIRDLPVIDYHCHLDERAIAENRKFTDLGDLWLSGDHYKWRAMRLTGVDEAYITGKIPPREKFLAFAGILPELIGNPVYHWTHMELRALFGIDTPLSAETAPEIWEKANAVLETLTVRDLLRTFRVEYIATTDDPRKELRYHGDYDGIKVRPTFRPDACFEDGLGYDELETLLKGFLEKGCRIVDHGFDFLRENDPHLLWLIRMCLKYGLVLQLHFGTMRNVNSRAFRSIGRDAGFDVFRGAVDTDALARILDRAHSELGDLPLIILYPLNDAALRPLATISGAFPNVRIGAAWWFNDTASGIRRQMETVSEYAAFGTQIGMLTDSRSFSSYVRFDYYRRILASFIGEKTENGEYDAGASVALAKKVAYENAKEAFHV